MFFLYIVSVSLLQTGLSNKMSNILARTIAGGRPVTQSSMDPKMIDCIIKRLMPLVAAGGLHFASTGRRQQGTTLNDGAKKDNESSSHTPFDITKQWNNAKDYLEHKVLTDRGMTKELSTKDWSDDKNSSKQGGLLGFLHGLTQDMKNHRNDDAQQNVKETQENKQNLQDVQSSLMGLLMGPNQRMVEELIAKARNSSEQGDVSDSVSLEELMTILKIAGEEFGNMIEKYLDGKDLPSIWPTNLYYFVEFEDEVKNFSYRRRKHRFCRGINVEYVNELNSFMRIAEIGYLDDMERIKKELSETFGYEVMYCQMDSLPGQPSHFLAIKKDQSSWSSSLDMLICVRGTKSITDVITDLLADEVDYRGGKAHSGICKGGQYLAEKHMDTFQEFLKASGKKKINLTLVGHSLGAGAASIAGIELQDKDDFDVQVIGFGCPALLSKELAESTKEYITTVVADNDCIPRMSLASMLNTILDIGQYNWIPRAQQDLEDVINQVQSALPAYITDTVKKNLLEMLDSKVLSSIDIPLPTKERMKPVLFPRTFFRKILY